MNSHTKKYIAGIDEAGRGALAGPLVVGAVFILRQDPRPRRILRGIKDSKKLTSKQRELWYERLIAHPSFHWIAVKISHKTIDRINIGRSASLGALKAVTQCIKKYPHMSSLNSKILLDGGLYLPDTFDHTTIIKGDEKEPLIAAASIIAKVTRDRLMLRLHKKYPHYRFDLHQGYGTALHRMRIRRYGYSPHHRHSFKIKTDS